MNLFKSDTHNHAIRSMSAMLIMVILVGMGERMAERFLPLYLLAVGGSSWTIAALNGMTNLLSALYSLPGGYLAEKLGYKKSLMLFTTIAMAGYSIVLIFPMWQAVLAGAVLFIAWSAVTLPAVMSLVNKVMPKTHRTLGVSLHSLIRRIPMALGPLIGGALIVAFGRVHGVQLAFAGALIMGFLALVIEYRFMKDDPPNHEATLIKVKNFKHYFNPSLLQLLASDILIRFAEQIPYAFVVIWVVNYAKLSEWQFGLLTSIEMITAMLIYIPVAWFADQYGKKPFVLITFGFFTVFPLFLFFAKGFWMFALAFVIRGLKEFGEPTRKALIMDLARDDAKAQTFGTYYLLRDIVVSVAAFSSAWLWNLGPAVNFFTAFAFGLLGTILFALYGKDVAIEDQQDSTRP